MEYQPHMKCIADLEGVLSEDEAPDTSYYQWVVFMMLLQAGMFYLPYKVWQSIEGERDSLELLGEIRLEFRISTFLRARDSLIY